MTRCCVTLNYSCVSGVIQLCWTVCEIARETALFAGNAPHAAVRSVILLVIFRETRGALLLHACTCECDAA